MKNHREMFSLLDYYKADTPETTIHIKKWNVVLFIQ